jgi:hypothetical protein
MSRMPNRKNSRCVVRIEKKNSALSQKSVAALDGVLFYHTIIVLHDK